MNAVRSALSILHRLFRGSTEHAAGRPKVRLGLEDLENRMVPTLSGFNSPYIVELRATFPDHKTFVGSGAMVDRFHVLTAGHVLYSAADGGWASSIQATPDLKGASHPYGSAYMTYERTYQGFINYDKTHPHSTAPGDHDIGLITLDRTIGDRTGWASFGYDNNNADFRAGSILNTAGYPAAGGYDGTHQEVSYGPIAGLSSDGSAIEYRQSSITTYGGQSGSPVWRYTPSDGKSVIYGVHVGGTGTATSLNFATRITQSIFNDLQTWRKADAVPKAPAASTGLSLTQLHLFSTFGNAQSVEAEAIAAPPGAASSDGKGSPAHANPSPTIDSASVVSALPAAGASTPTLVSPAEKKPIANSAVGLQQEVAVAIRGGASHFDSAVAELFRREAEGAWDSFSDLGLPSPIEPHF